jgi:hypothetical protein
MRKARDLFPDAPVIAVNAAAGFVKALMLFTLHPDKMPSWANRQRRRFGGGFTTHTARTPYRINKLRMPANPVQYAWDFGGGKGSSAWGARRLAGYVGFDPVVLCGVPLAPSPYMTGLNAKAFGKPDICQGYRGYIASDTEWHPGVHGVSGWPLEFFGAP